MHENVDRCSTSSVSCFAVVEESWTKDITLNNKEVWPQKRRLQ